MGILGTNVSLYCLEMTFIPASFVCALIPSRCHLFGRLRRATCECTALLHGDSFEALKAT